ncbi:MAG: glycosyltransferase family 39 protein [Chloroflexi bacterium]|nr:glycosyltransferase family 39 protein [Chloroflexota bacterium]
MAAPAATIAADETRFARRRDVLLLCAVLILAALLRLTNLSQIEFKLDEARHLESAQRIVTGQEFPLVGSRSSVGVAKPALFTWLLAIPALFGRDPRLAAGFIALLNVAAAGGLFWTGKRYFGWLPALLAALLYAVNPWAVFFSRDIFTADILAPFCLLLWVGLLRWLADGRPGGLALALAALGALLGITFSPWPLALLTAVLVFSNLRQVKVKWLLVGLALALVLLASWLIYQARSGFSEFAPVLAKLTTGGAQSAEGGGISGWLKTFWYAVWLHSGLNLSSLAGVSAAEFMPDPLWLGQMDKLLAALFIGALLLAGWRGVGTWVYHMSARAAAPWRILVLWLWLPLLVMGLQPAELQVHYMVILFPAGFMAMGITAEYIGRTLFNSLRGAAHWALAAALAALLVLVLAHHIGSTFYLADFVQSHATNYGIPLSSWLRISEQAPELLSTTDAEEIWITAQGSDPAIDTEPAVLSYLLADSARTVYVGQGGQEGLLLPVERPALYLLTSAPERTLATLAKLDARVMATVALPDGRTAYYIYASPHTAETTWEALYYRKVHYASDAGLQLTGYDWLSEAQPGMTAQLATYWTFGAVPDEARAAQHSAFNQLFYADGRKAAQDDGFSLPEAYWQEGRVLLQWFDLALPADLAPGAYALLTGLYRLSDGGRATWADAAGQALGDALELSALQVTSAE